MAMIAILSTITVLILLGIVGGFMARRLKNQKSTIKKLPKSAPPQTYFDKYAKRSDLLKASYPTDAPASKNPESADSSSTEN
ncbi:MAG TPA: hypothetical protein PK360_02040 [bacterium]|nr:hypothetical protein [bacterium]